jgi:hypothetical protein
VHLSLSNTWNPTIRFGALRAEGGAGAVSRLLLDLEGFVFGFGHFFVMGANNSRTFSRWVEDSRWPALLADLNAAGAAYGASFDDMTAAANASCCNSGAQCAPGCDYRDYRPYVWNAVMSRRTAAYINTSVYAPVRQHFPSVEAANYDHSHYSSEAERWAYTRYEYVTSAVGRGVHVGTHSSRALYSGPSDMEDIEISHPAWKMVRSGELTAPSATIGPDLYK